MRIHLISTSTIGGACKLWSRVALDFSRAITTHCKVAGKASHYFDGIHYIMGSCVIGNVSGTDISWSSYLNVKVAEQYSVRLCITQESSKALQDYQTEVASHV